MKNSSLTFLGDVPKEEKLLTFSAAIDEVHQPCLWCGGETADGYFCSEYCCYMYHKEN